MDESTTRAAEGLRKIIAAACDLKLDDVTVTPEVNGIGRGVMHVELPSREDDAP